MSSSSDVSLPPLDDEALYAGWRRIGQPNRYRGPGDQERNDIAEGEGGRHLRRGVLARQGRLREERRRLRRAEEKHAQQQQQEEEEEEHQRQLQSEQRHRELLERQALLHQMREMLMSEMSEPRGETNLTLCAVFDEREIVLFEERWHGEYEGHYLTVDDERAEPFGSLATLKQEHRQWHKEVGWFEPPPFGPDVDSEQSDDDLPESDAVGIRCGWQVPLRDASVVEMAQARVLLHRLRASRCVAHDSWCHSR